MSRLIFDNSPKTHSEMHRDYQTNLESAKQWIFDNHNQVSDVFRVYLADSHNNRKSLLMFSFTPIMSVQIGKYGHPISLNQDKMTFDEELRQTSKKYKHLNDDYFSEFAHEHEKWSKEMEMVIKNCPYAVNQVKNLISNYKYLKGK